MKKIVTIIASIAAAFTIVFSTASCEKYLDKAPDSDITEKDAFGNFTAFQGFVEQLYNVVMGYDKGGAWNRYSFADEDLTIATSNFDTGNWWGNESYFFGKFSPTTNEGRNQRIWEASWYGIRTANMAIEHLEKEDSEFVGTDEERNLLKGQALFFRAFHYYQICRYWGGMPYVTHVIGAAEDMTSEEYNRLTAQECFINMAKDFAAAAELLPNHWDETTAGQVTKGNNDYRVNKHWALGFQGKALLWAASPMLNEEAGKGNSFNADLAKQAADALGKCLKLCEDTGTYKLETWANYEGIFAKTGWNRPGGKEVLMNETLYNRSRVYWSCLGATVPASFGCNSSTTQQDVPTANITHNYGMKNGLPIDDPESGYNPADPWSNRDPRFDKTIITDGDRISKNIGSASTDYYAQLYNGGRHRNGGSYGAGSVTGLFFRKFNLMGANFIKTSNANNLVHSIPYLRMADIYLMYAEAVTHMSGGGPSAKASTYSLTAIEALEKVRARAQLPALPARYTSDKDTFFEAIVRERAVELIMEAQRFDDLRRWNRIADPRYLDKTRYDFDRDADGKPTNIQEVVHITRVASSPKMNWLPIQVKYTKMYAGFPQNPGW